MLFSQDGGRHQHRYLESILNHLEGGADCHFGFPITDIAAEQPVHWFICNKVVDDIVDCLILSRSFVIGKGFFQFGIELGRAAEGMPLPEFPFGVKIKQILGHRPHRFLHLFFRPAPGFTAQAVQFRGGIRQPLVF